jgi:anthranilate phosphoribosyltransferase
VAGGAIAEDTLDPTTLGFAPAKLEELVGGDAMQNAAIVEDILSGAIKGAKRDIAVLNAAAGFVITGKAADMSSGKSLAESLLDRGAAHAKLCALRDWC